MPRDVARFLVFVLATLLIGAATACGDGDGASPRGDGTAAVASPTAREETTDEEDLSPLAERGLLRLDDFPAGWTAAPPDEEPDLDLDVPPECEGYLTQEDPPGTLVSVDSQEFSGPDGEQVESDVAIMEDVQAAEGALEQLQDFLDTCREPFQEAFRQALDQIARESPDNAGIENISVTNVDVQRISFPPHGDEQVALRMTATLELEGLAFRLVTDVIFFRVSQASAGLTYFVVGEPDRAHEEQLATVIEQRISMVAGELE